MTLPPMANLIVDIEFSPKSQISRYHFFFECLYIAILNHAQVYSTQLEPNMLEFMYLPACVHTRMDICRYCVLAQ